MTNHNEHSQTPPQNKPLFMPGFPFTSLTNLPARRKPSELVARTERQRQQANLAAVQQHRAAALAAQQRLAAQRAQDTQRTEFRKQLTRIQQLCRQNRRDDTCPPECVVRQWRQGVPLEALDGVETFRRRLNGNR